MLFPFPLQSWAYTQELFDNGVLRDGRSLGYTLGDVAEHRRTVLDADGLELTFFLMQGVFELLGGGRPWADEQAERLWNLARRPGVTIRVILYSAGAFPGMEVGDHALLEFENAYPVIRYTSLLRDMFAHHIEAVDATVAAFDRLDEMALSPAESLAFIEKRVAPLLTGSAAGSAPAQ
jgi:hypothetical protein